MVHHQSLSDYKVSFFIQHFDGLFVISSGRSDSFQKKTFASLCLVLCMDEDVVDRLINLSTWPLVHIYLFNFPDIGQGLWQKLLIVLRISTLLEILLLSSFVLCRSKNLLDEIDATFEFHIFDPLNDSNASSSLIPFFIVWVERLLSFEITVW